MEAIEQLLCECDETVAHAMVGMRAVNASNAYYADCPYGVQGGMGESLTHVYRVECRWDHSYESLQCGVSVIDHHHPGDPGYGRPPEEFLAASSIGQVIQELRRLGVIRPDWVVPKRLVLIAAADQCLGAAYRGECPGVDPDELGQFRAEERARHQRRTEPGVTPALILERIAATQRALQDAECLVLDGDISVRDMRRDTPWPELPEAATRMGVGYVSGPLVDPDGRRKITCSGSAEQVRAWLTCWAPRNGVSDTYGDPSRGFAGGYLP